MPMWRNACGYCLQPKTPLSKPMCIYDFLGATLWDNKVLGENIQVKPSPKTESRIIESDSLADQLSALRAPGALRLSLLCGLVEARGAAQILGDSQRCRPLARVTLHYSTTTKLKQLNQAALSCPRDGNLPPATHVVTGIQYGAQVFFVFEQPVSPSEDVHEIQKNLRALIEGMPRFLPNGGKGLAELSETEKARAEKTACRVYSDTFPGNPEGRSMTFKEAVDMYSTFPKDLAEQAVPVRLWLQPLDLLEPKIVHNSHEICTELVCEIQNILQQLAEIDKQCAGLANAPVATTFPAMKSKLQRFQGLIRQYKQLFQKRLSRIIPAIRRREEGEDCIVEILTSNKQSLFSFEQLSAFLERKEKEMTFVNSYLAALKGAEVVATKKELDQLLVNPMLKCVLAFVFTSLQDEEPYLSDLESSLAIRKSQSHGPTASGSETPDYKLWLEHREISRRAREAARAFSGLASLSSDDTKLIITALPDQEHPGASLYLYEDGELVSTNFESPSQPSPPVPGEVGQDTIQLLLTPASYGKRDISAFRVEYRAAGQEDWVAVNTGDKQETCTVTGLLPDTGYQFRYAAVGSLGLSERSDPTGTVRTLPIRVPAGSEKITAERPPSPLTGHGASSVGSDHGGQQYEPARDNGKEEGPKGGGAKMKRCDSKGRKKNIPGDDSLASSHAETAIAPEPAIPLSEDKRAAVKLLKQSRKLEECGPLSIYQLPIKPSASSSSSCMKYKLGHENAWFPHKVIMVMGATGSGKTTLINGMVNYILGVEWKDHFRFKLIHEETHRSQAQSQTAGVTAYAVNYTHGFQIPYNLTIIDTPGFGDTRGIEHDKQITAKIRDFFSTPGGIEHIDGICFVVQSSLPRLTQAQKYVFDSVLSIFGKDIKGNIQILVTFADGQRPPVLEAILESEVPCAQNLDGSLVHYKFNNSALFASNHAASEDTFCFDAMFWKMGAYSMKDFFASLQTLEPRSLRLTKEVLQERKRLETAVQGLQPQIKAGLATLEAIRKTQQALEQHRDEMDANKEFEVEVEHTVPVKHEVTKGFLTNCQTCHFTCHYPCAYSNDADKYKCSSMDKGKCTVCPGKCVWDVHYNQKYRWEYKTKKEKQTYTQLKARYEKARGEAMTTEKIFEQLYEDYQDMEHVVLRLIEESSRSIERLQEIALKPIPMATPEHIDLLIEAEKQEAKPGFQDRIRSLEGVREMAVIVNKIARGEPLLPAEQKAAKKHNANLSRPQKVCNYVKGWFASLA
ncbi:uncharacterized protein LOC123017883 [Varanus komodoensis]|uniref:uncharacterized protein LOC123017883 n=1 Tax=Varanus komodoensis TaxID=61221 RepID=UPI001CF78159|nr:uncharacterized protein LOC123017883 [Varanus komodoensis]